MIKLSIIVPIYNTEKYLEKCLNSIIEQFNENMEVILVDDGSTDSSGSICEDYKKKNLNIRVIHKKNGGLVSARKAGVSIAVGEYIGFIDSDDWIEKTYFTSMLERALETNADIICSGHTVWSDNGRRIAINRIKSGLYQNAGLETIIRDMLYVPPYFDFGIYPNVWCKLIKLELAASVINTIPDEINYGEDAMCTYPVLLRAEKVCVDNEITGYFYRQVSTSMTHAYDPKKIDKACLLLRTVEDSFGCKMREKDLSRQLWYYYSWIIRGVIKNEITSNTKSMTKINELKRFHDSDIIAEILKQNEALPISYSIMINLFKNAHYRALTMLFELFLKTKG